MICQCAYQNEQLHIILNSYFVKRMSTKLNFLYKLHAYLYIHGCVSSNWSWKRRIINICYCTVQQWKALSFLSIKEIKFIPFGFAWYTHLQILLSWSLHCLYLHDTTEAFPRKIIITCITILLIIYLQALWFNDEYRLPINLMINSGYAITAKRKKYVDGLAICNGADVFWHAKLFGVDSLPST